MLVSPFIDWVTGQGLEVPLAVPPPWKEHIKRIPSDGSGFEACHR